MKKIIPYIPKIASYFFILLFCYAAISKAMDFENFQVQIGQSPLLSAYTGFVSYAVIISEVVIVLLLIFPRSNLLGLYSSTALMSAFTIYIFLILNYSEFVPCSCGGILEKMGWIEHLIFNITCIILGCISVIINEKEKYQSYIKTALILLIFNVLSSAVVIILFIRSEHVIKKENNFTRRFLQFPVVEDKSLQLVNDRFYFAGTAGREIYLGSRYNPLIISKVDNQLENIQEMKVHPDRMNYDFRNLQVKVKPPYYYLADGTVPVLYRGRIGSSKTKLISYNDAFFSQISIIDSTKFAIRTQKSQDTQLTAALLNLHTNPKVIFKTSILTKQSDGVFDSDGQLINISSPERYIYLYAYRNQMMVMDKELNLIKTLKTIDTTTIARIKTIKMKDGQHKMTEPPLVVNHKITAYGNLAFIHSNLKGRFEKNKTWQSSSIVDIYRTDRQEYVGSFYIDKLDGKSFTDMMMTDRYLFVLNGQRLIRYSYRSLLTQILQGKPKT